MGINKAFESAHRHQTLQVTMQYSSKQSSQSTVGSSHTNSKSALALKEYKPSNSKKSRQQSKS